MDAHVTTSRYPFPDTVARVRAAIVAGGNRIFAEIDQRAAAEEAGLHLRPTVLFVFGNPRGGTPLMDAAPLSALDLPLKALVWEEAGSVRVAYTPPATVAERYGVTGHDALVNAMERTLQAVVAAAVGS